MLCLFCASDRGLQAQEKNSSGDTAKVNLWNTENLPPSAVWRYGATDRNPEAIGVYGLKFSSDGNLLALRDRRQNIRVLNLAQEQLQAIIPTQNVLDMAFSPDDKFVISGNRRTTQIWDVTDGSLARNIQKPGFKIASSKKSSRFTIIGKGTVHRYLWPLPTKPQSIKSALSGTTILPAGISPDGEIAVFHNGRECELLKANSGIPIVPTLKTVPKRVIISPDRNHLAEIKHGSQSLQLFDLRNVEKYRYSLKAERRIVTSAFSNDSRFLFTSNYDNRIIIWDLVTMQTVDRLEGHNARVYTLAGPPQLCCVASGASGSSDRSVIFWDFRDRLFPEIEDHGDFLFDPVWNDLGSNDPKVSLAATNQLYRALQRDSSAMDELLDRTVVSGNGKELAEQLIKDLDDPKYRVREKATLMLKQIANQIRPLLEQQLENGSQEAKWRIEKVLRTDRLKPNISTTVGRREHRIVLALELLGNAKAIKALDLLAQSTSRKNLAAQARDAVDRLGKPAER